jgi:hypothetical protein
VHSKTLSDIRIEHMPSPPKTKRTHSASKLSPTTESRNLRSRRKLDDTEPQLSTIHVEKLTTISFKQFAAFVERHIDPFTNKIIEADMIRTHYIDIITKYLNKWIESPFVDPFDDNPIVLQNNNVYFKQNRYKELYHLFYVFLQHKNKDSLLPAPEIIGILPKEHLLFDKKMDILAYKENPRNAKTGEQNIYEFIAKFLEIMNYTGDPIQGYEKYGNTELTAVYVFCSLYTSVLANYMNYISKMFVADTMVTYDTFVGNIKDFISNLNLLNTFIKTYDTYESLKLMIIYNNYLVSEELVNKLKSSIPVGFVNMIYDSIMMSPNFVEQTLSNYEELFKIYDYKHNPDASPFVNLDNIKFSTIEDPLVKILNQIGIQEIDLKTLDLEPRIFTDDKEYDDYQKQFKALKDEYVAKRNIWSDYEDGKSSGSPPAKPKPPILLLPDGTKINVLTQYLPRHIPDKKYNELKEYLDKNKDTLDMYRSYINKNLFDILPQTGKSINLNLIDKNRDYFIQNVLYDGSDDINKCSNTESLNVEFDDDILLSRLQLMFQMKVYNQNDELIRTDCFYAPDLYNHIVTKLNDRLPVTNPFTNSIIEEDKLKVVIDDLMKIMKVLDPNIQRPYYVKPAHDTGLFIKQVPLRSPSNQEFIQLRLMRRFDSMDIPLYNICIIPNDINPDSTGSTDISSAVFASTVEILFDKGILLHNYLPPYNIQLPNRGRLFIKPTIHFNNYSAISQWSNKTKEQQIEMMKHYLEELKQYLY